MKEYIISCEFSVIASSEEEARRKAELKIKGVMQIEISEATDLDYEESILD
jgi:hypothetical protein